ncbi:FecR family protein [Methylobacillus gramineus]|uniref:FecR domain-containing protein n=1 Tax=Methylobacillus gramineus TaxID=755169 RepID=UPI001CFF928C|nr:FecR family protein [Methylobacillus gramineus]MCB5183990.1 FecR family protein [Methylobacillus gramineus]
MPPPSFSPEVSKAAAEWLTLSMDQGLSSQDAERLRQWRHADPEHERAWQHIEHMSTNLHRLNGNAAYQTLSKLHSTSRRSTLKSLAWLGLLTSGGMLSSKTESWQLHMADYSTGTGELKELQLEDGTRIVLNTRSAIDVHLTSTQRTVTLRSGEVMVTTGHLHGDIRPFKLATIHGNIQPLGTQFTVRLNNHNTQVTVLEGAVNIAPKQGAGTIIQADQHTWFSANQVHAVTKAPAQTAAWSKGQLFATNMRLGDLAQELERYRPGFILCDEQVADLKISGVFALNDTSQALEAITNSLPVNIVYRTRYWVRITASDPS